MNIKERFKNKFENYSENNEYFVFELREEQLEFLEIWNKAVNDKKIALIDAPTGIGKTFAYLYPVMEKIIEAEKKDESFKAIIATSTINLQEQIFEKDLPLLSDIFDENFKVKLLKGRRNYACRRKAEEFIRNSDDSEVTKLLINWLNETFSGEYQEIENKISSYHWRQIESQASTCLGKTCRHYRHCYFFNSRIEAENSEILIINHHLLITDTAKKEYPFIKEADALIIDEAHNFIPTIESILTKMVSLLDVKYQLDELIKLNSELKFLNFFEKDEELLQNWEDIVSASRIFKAETERFFKKLKELLEKKGQLNLNKDDIDYYLLDSFYYSLEEYIKELDIFRNPLSYIDLKFKDFSQTLSETKAARFKGYLVSYSSVVEYFDEVKIVLNEYFLEKRDNFIVAKWLDIKDKNIVFNALDLNNSDDLSKEIIPIEKAVLFTSATLSLNKEFYNIKVPLGISDAETVEVRLKSPFDLKNQMTIKVASLNYSYQNKEYYERLNNILLKVLKNGHALVLFASYNDMNLIYKKFKSKFGNKKIKLYMQGKEFSRSELIEIFKTEENSILFGTRSFWEGIDIKGGKLTTVVITKLPFKSINDPVVYSKDKLLKLKGRNSFYEFMLPDMILTLKQGIGRLIRSKNDIGRVYILDSRFNNSSYSSVIMREFKDFRIEDFRGV